MDPTFEMGKDARIKKLNEEINKLKDLKIDLSEGYRLIFKLKEEEFNKL